MPAPLPPKPLTAAAIAKLRPAKDRREIPDSGCPGLYLLIQPSGAKGWALRYRRPDGRPAKLVLGSVYTNADKEPDTLPAIGGHLTLAAAHRLVTALRHEIAQGRDPAAAHMKAKQDRRIAAAESTANTFAAAARDFIEGHARKKVRRWTELARVFGLEPDTLEMIPRGLADRWAERPVTEIDGHDIHTVVDEARRLGIPGLKRRTDGPSEPRARKLYGVLSKLFSWLLQHRRVAANPCTSVHRPETPKARDRVLSNAEIRSFWNADVGDPYASVIKMLLLTGCRLNEVVGMKWAEIGDDGVTWTIPGERTKNHRPHVVPLAPLARDLLANAKRIEGCPFVFTATGTAVGGWSRHKMHLDAAMKPAAPWVLHDLRRTAATGMAEIGIAPHIIEAVLNHVSGARAGVAGVYNRAAYLPEKTAALERWAAHVEGLVSGQAAKVTPLRPKISVKKGGGGGNAIAAN
jgi:integrase